MVNKESNTFIEAIRELITIVAALRSPVGGCPWDLAQTHNSLIPYLLEEANEVADAIRNGDDDNLKEELGDLLLQIVLHTQIAEDENRFCLKEVAESINQKLIRRHPHVFGNENLETINEVKKSWELIKRAEKPFLQSKSPISDGLKRKVRSQTPIYGAMEISKKTANKGFKWENVESIWDKVDEELRELKEALNKKDFSNAQEELGDIIFTLINIAHWFDLNPEEGLNGTNQRFLDRFSYFESNLEGNFSKHSSNDLFKLWKTAKNETYKKKKKNSFT